MSLLSRLFGRGDAASQAPESEHEPQDYKGFAIRPEPIKEGNHYRVAARIEKTVDGTARTHSLIRADTLSDRDAAIDASVSKAKQVIDEQGDRLFG
ncbi:hypothetical protein EKE94_02115 [Mesobaculum littorinae]|uniref:Transcriptional activator HlyU n=1 Tax=Mesobaculum littorinae TaxID=2486419 RepID=A0A438AKZ4_9RHOB|nr:HlyU family transcriptional regulator [Mesobaculum littorinae]RVV99501.1 hypothetical protein EKE94_02115 [Mesobaculum littorinae]